MLQAHSTLWNYLWIAPNVLLFILGILLWRRGLGRRFPAFIAFATLSATGEFATFLADHISSVTAAAFWRTAWVGLLVESLLKFFVIGEMFSQVFNPYSSIARLGRTLVSGFGAALVFLAALVAALSRGDSSQWIVSEFHKLELTVFIVELGLIVFIFLLAGYFHFTLNRMLFGLLLGFGISSCEHLATWAIIANANPSAAVRTYFDFLNMATFHLCVLIWFYCFLVPERSRKSPPKPPASGSGISLPENNLTAWNHELERFSHQ